MAGALLYSSSSPVFLARSLLSLPFVLASSTAEPTYQRPSERTKRKGLTHLSTFSHCLEQLEYDWEEIVLS